MSEYEKEIRQNLENDWGPAATHSDYKPGDILRYRLPGAGLASGLVIWVTGPGESPVEGRDPLPLRYICERHGMADDSFPDVVYSSDILSGNAEEEVTIEYCPYCGGRTLHPKWQSQYCPKNPNRPH
jgi:hypothetical protein